MLLASSQMILKLCYVAMYVYFPAIKKKEHLHHPWSKEPHKHLLVSTYYKEKMYAIENMDYTFTLFSYSSMLNAVSV